MRQRDIGNDPPLETRRSWHAAALVFAMALPTVGTWLYFIVLAGQAAMQAAYGLTKVVQFAFPLVWVVGIQRRTLRLTTPATTGVAAGLAFGAAVLAAMLALYFAWLRHTPLIAEAAGEVETKVNEIGIATPLGFLGLALFYCLLHSLAEEYYWRWFVFGQLHRVLPLPAAVLLSSLAFMAHHVLVVATYMWQYPPALIFFSLSVAVGGAYWAWLYHRSGSLYGPWLSHLLVDAGIMIVGYDMIWGFTR